MFCTTQLWNYFFLVVENHCVFLAHIFWNCAFFPRNVREKRKTQTKHYHCLSCFWPSTSWIQTYTFLNERRKSTNVSVHILGVCYVITCCFLFCKTFNNKVKQNPTPLFLMCVLFLFIWAQYSKKITTRICSLSIREILDLLWTNIYFLSMLKTYKVTIIRLSILRNMIKQSECVFIVKSKSQSSNHLKR